MLCPVSGSGPGSIHQAGVNQIGAAGGLMQSGGGIISEPATLPLLVAGVAAVLISRFWRSRK
jgi:hypothetical protein